jgi:hypothetical protein
MMSVIIRHMKIILTAFNRKLASELLEYPEETPLSITLPMPIDGRKWMNYSGKVEVDEPIQSGYARFEFIGSFLLIRGESAREYQLIDWYKTKI